MAKLPNEIKTFIVRSLAWGDSVSSIVRAVKDEHDAVVTKQQVSFYDPRHGAKPGDQWVQLFNAEREKAQQALDDLPLAGVAARVRMRSRWVGQLEGKGNVVAANDVLSDIARDVGGMFTNRRELTGKDGEKLFDGRSVADLSDDELRAIGSAILGASPSSPPSSAQSSPQLPPHSDTPPGTSA